jgi:dihydrofolate synthase / folylpolyglutamate synthase
VRIGFRYCYHLSLPYSDLPRKEPEVNYREALDYLETLPDMERARHGSGISMSLESMKALLSFLGNPERKAKTIHITGSKGKGSTATLITSILNAAGYRTAMFTSPHLHSYRERIAFDLMPVNENDFASGLAQIRDVLRDEKVSSLVYPISTFGILTALFFLLVANRNPVVDWQIVEVGLGGALDATNVFSRKELAVITPISLEHTALLGNTTASIAQHKAGIITPGAKVVLARQSEPDVKEVIAAACRTNDAALTDVAKKLTVARTSFSLDEQRFYVRNGSGATEFSMALRGRHQIENALTAIASVDMLKASGYEIDDEAKLRGLKTAKISGRFEVLSAKFSESNTSKGMLAQIGAGTIILDGAHNAASAAILSQALKDYFPEQKCIFILALNSDKRVEDFWLELKEQSAGVIATRADNPRALAPETVAERIKSCDSSANVYSAPSVTGAIETALSLDSKDALICVTGSLYLVAEARELVLGERA